MFDFPYNKIVFSCQGCFCDTAVEDIKGPVIGKTRYLWCPGCQKLTLHFGYYMI